MGERLTDDKIFELSTRIHRIESSIITRKSIMEPDSCYMDQQYGELLELRRQLDEQLGFKADEEQIVICQGCHKDSDDRVLIVARRKAICSSCLDQVVSYVSKSISIAVDELLRRSA